MTLLEKLREQRSEILQVAARYGFGSASSRRLNLYEHGGRSNVFGAYFRVCEIDWRALSGFRNVLVHDYLGGIDLAQVWDAVEHYLPDLERTVRSMMASME